MTLRIFAAAALAATTSLHAAPALAQGTHAAGQVNRRGHFGAATGAGDADQGSGIMVTHGPAIPRRPRRLQLGAGTASDGP